MEAARLAVVLGVERFLGRERRAVLRPRRRADAAGSAPGSRPSRGPGRASRADSTAGCGSRRGRERRERRRGGSGSRSPRRARARPRRARARAARRSASGRRTSSRGALEPRILGPVRRPGRAVEVAPESADVLRQLPEDEVAPVAAQRRVPGQAPVFVRVAEDELACLDGEVLRARLAEALDERLRDAVAPAERLEAVEIRGSEPVQVSHAVPAQQRRLLLLESRELRTVGRERRRTPSTLPSPARPSPSARGRSCPRRRGSAGGAAPSSRHELAGELTHRLAVDAETAEPRRGERDVDGAALRPVLRRGDPASASPSQLRPEPSSSKPSSRKVARLRFE